MDATCYTYDAGTGELLGQSAGDPSPLQPGVYLYPAHTTPIAPPASTAGQRPVWGGAAWSLVPDHRGEAWYAADGGAVTIDRLGDPAAFNPPLSAKAPPPPPPTAPDNPTLSDYRVALTLWGRIDDVSARIAALVASSDSKQAMLGKIAKERFEYANTVQRAQLMALKDALGFSEADVDESLWRAGQVAKGDLSGVWPLPAKSG